MSALSLVDICRHLCLFLITFSVDVIKKMKAVNHTDFGLHL